ncbi:MAG TPA: EamA family transporter [Gaiella sp.]|uniref:EamA family transporter n=1 Tax=Gaiella sp. TaxID=2663207 RepID=UPI002D7F3B7F|nr:EamA family transporter [Gaiella sp.]HET9288209.1 EamA family transporter [Gaiella sp.]
MTEIVLHGARPAGRPHPRLGYAMVTTASALFAVNGTVSKVILTQSGVTSVRLTELRATGAFLGLAAVLAVTAPGRLRVPRDELALLVFYGIVGFALVQWLYLVSIERLPIGIGLLLEFTAPVLVALWARLVWHEPVRRRVWAALALAFVGLVGVAEVWQDFRLDTVGVVAGLLAAGALATYYLAGEHQTARRDALSLTCLSLGVAAVFWAVLQPWWSFPFDELGATVPLDGPLESASAPVWALCLWVVVPGTILPFALSLGALHHLPATRVATVSMLEVLLASIVAWAWLGETLSAAQLAGGVIVLLGVVLAQTSR